MSTQPVDKSSSQTPETVKDCGTKAGWGLKLHEMEKYVPAHISRPP